MGWYVAGGLLAAFLGVLVVWQPLAAAVVILGLAALAVFALRPKLGVGLAVLSILFGSGLPTITGIEVLGYLDEIMVAVPLVFFTARRVLRREGLRKLPGTLWILLYLTAGFVSSGLRDVPFEMAAQSSFLMLKGFFFAFAVAQLDWEPADVRKFVKPAAWVVSIILLLSVINFAIPAIWAGIFSRRSTGVDYRLGLPSLIGPFDHEFAYGQFMAIAAVAILAYRINVKKGRGSAILLAGTFLGLILSFRRKAIGAALGALFVVRTITPGSRTGTVLATILLVPVAVFIGWDSITSIVDATYQQYFDGNTEAARTILYRDSVILAIAAFPFGVGFGRFGSFMASQEYSPEYIALGYPNIYGLAPGERGPYLSDTFWPAIVGEAGVIGVIGFAAAVFVLARQGFKLSRSTEDPYVRWAGVVLVAWFIEFTIESLAAPVYNTPPLFGLLFGLAGVVVALVAQQSPTKPPVAPKILSRR